MDKKVWVRCLAFADHGRGRCFRVLDVTGAWHDSSAEEDFFRFPEDQQGWTGIHPEPAFVLARLHERDQGKCGVFLPDGKAVIVSNDITEPCLPCEPVVSEEPAKPVKRYEYLFGTWTVHCHEGLEVRLNNLGNDGWMIVNIKEERSGADFIMMREKPCGL